MSGDHPRLLACELERRGRFLIGDPWFDAGQPIALGRAGAEPAREGSLVLVELAPEGGRGRVERVLGDPSDIGAVMEAYAAECGCARPFPPAALAEARRLPDDPPPPTGARRDLRDRLCFTVDPGTAKDHDDAIGIERAGDGFRVLVHIADVAQVVPEGGPLDLEALERGFSVYLPGRVDPMLPPALSNGLCSLREGRPRDVLSVEVLLDAALRPTSRSFGRSQIRSRRHLSYEQVEAILGGGADCEPELRAALTDLDRVAHGLRERRLARGALALQRPELELELAEGRVRGARMIAEPRAHLLVEELMLLANESVAELLEAKGQPALFRVHEPPDPDQVQRLYRQLAALGVPTPALDEQLGPRAAAVAVAEASRSVGLYAASAGRGAEAWSTLVLRGTQKARYDAAPIGHSGLAAASYCHFTSPIRRYPDLIVHRALLAALGLGPASPRTDLREEAERLSDIERSDDVAEHRAEDICLARLLAERLERGDALEAFSGEIVGMIGAGLFVRFGGVFEGMLHSRRLAPRDRYELDELGVALVGTTSGHAYRLGDRIEVVVERIDDRTGKVSLDRAES